MNHLCFGWIHKIVWRRWPFVHHNIGKSTPWYLRDPIWTLTCTHLTYAMHSSSFSWVYQTPIKNSTHSSSFFLTKKTNYLYTLMWFKFGVQIHDLGALRCMYMLNFYISYSSINVVLFSSWTYEIVLDRSSNPYT